MGYSNLANPGNYQQAAFGQKGFEFLDGSGNTTGNYNAVQVIADATVTIQASAGDGLTNVDLPAGMTIVGKFTSVSISSGKVLAYNG